MFLAGLDIETTGTDINAGHRLIQIGIAIDSEFKLAQDVRPLGDMTISAEALGVNHFDLARIGAGLDTDVADIMVSSKLGAAGFKHGQLTPVGWNVGGFDMCFIKAELPRTAKFFSYRTLDLTGVAMMHELRTGIPYRDTKEQFHAEIVKVLGRDQRHDALYDAEAALIAVNLFKKL